MESITVLTSGNVKVNAHTAGRCKLLRTRDQIIEDILPQNSSVIPALSAPASAEQTIQPFSPQNRKFLAHYSE
jgi:hypothetical protein